MSDDQKNFPVPTLDVMVGEEPRTVTMYFTLLNDLATMVGSMERVPLISFDPDMRDRTIFLCLAPRDARGKIADPDWSWPWHMSVEAGEAILDFASDHSLDFFVARLRKQLTGLTDKAEDLEEVAASLSGLVALASKKSSS